MNPVDPSSRVHPAADALFAAALIGVGFATGVPILAGIVGGIGVNLASELTKNGWGQACRRMLGGEGALNHDLQGALQRAFGQAVDRLEDAWFMTGPGSRLHRHNADAPARALFADLRGRAATFCAADLWGRAAGNDQVRNLLYADESEVRSAVNEGLSALYTAHDSNLVEFVQGAFVRRAPSSPRAIRASRTICRRMFTKCAS